jgi:hypothetical protein
MVYQNKFIKKMLLLATFLFLITNVIQAQNTSLCDMGYIININGENRCIDTTLLYYSIPYALYYDTLSHDFIRYGKYPIWAYSILMKILNEEKWDNQSLCEDKMRIFILDYKNLNLILFSFYNLYKDTIQMIQKTMKVYFPPPKMPIAMKFLEKNSQKDSFLDTIYYFDFIDSTIFITDKIQWNNFIKDWYTENYGKVDTITYSVATYKIPRRQYMKLQKRVYNLDRYKMLYDIFYENVLIEYVINNKYQLNWIAQEGYIFYKDKFFKRNKDNLLKWLAKFM